MIVANIMVSMKYVFTLHKKIGETPLECLERFRAANTEYSDVPMTYAGRLDPMAEGVLLVLAGEECKQKDKYLSLNKEYETEIIFGVSTDTYDLLGLPTFGVVRNINDKDIREALIPYTGKITQKYPVYSSKTVGGVPLFELARRGLVDDMEIPTREVNIYSIDVINTKEINSSDLEKLIKEKVSKVKGDFRQRDILESWSNLLTENKDVIFRTVTLKVSCSSGTYIRGLAENLGRDIGTGALALSIKRTKVGEYN
jgi:tRNA pseudouridine55 synthase